MEGFGEKKTSKKKKLKANSSTRINRENLLNIAINHHVKGDLINAEKSYREAIKSGCTRFSIFSNLGIICKNSGRSDEAIYLYKKAIESNPNHPDAYSNLGNLFIDLGNLDEALASTLRSLELKPNHPNALTNLGRIQQLLNNLDEALSSTIKSLELEPDNPTAHMNLGSIYKDLGNLDQALASTLKSLELKPDNPGALSNLCSFYGEGDLTILKSAALNAANHNQDILNNLSFIEAISSLGKDFAKKIISTTISIN